MVWRNSEGICERKILFRMKKEADQAGFKDTQMGPTFLALLHVQLNRCGSTNSAPEKKVKFVEKLSSRHMNTGTQSEREWEFSVIHFLACFTSYIS